MQSIPFSQARAHLAETLDKLETVDEPVMKISPLSSPPSDPPSDVSDVSVLSDPHALRVSAAANATVVNCFQPRILIT